MTKSGIAWPVHSIKPVSTTSLSDTYPPPVRLLRELLTVITAGVHIWAGSGVKLLNTLA